jgi:tRNA threonylcarbamoyladenosine biosynthesis protein TsaE
MIIDIISKSPLCTKEIGKFFSRVLVVGNIALLDGELGAGKTTFITGVAEGFNIKEGISSPSFTILNIYEVSRNKKLVHADFYRLDNIDEILDTGIEDYLYSQDSYIFIEWGSKIKDYLKTGYIEIEFNYVLKSDSDYASAARDPEQLRSIIFRSENSYWVKKLEIFEKLLIRNEIYIKKTV